VFKKLPITDFEKNQIMGFRKWFTEFRKWFTEFRKWFTEFKNRFNS